jgi:hypothetical protein
MTEQEHGSEHPHRELGEEVGQSGNVAIDALDHLAWRSGIVEAHVELEAVPGKVFTQQVGSRPTDVCAAVGRSCTEELIG